MQERSYAPQGDHAPPRAQIIHPGLANAQPACFTGSVKSPSCELGYRGQTGQCHGNFRFIVLLINQLAIHVVAIRLHVEVAMATEIEQDGLASAFFLTLERLVDGGFDGMVGLRRWDYSDYMAGKLVDQEYDQNEMAMALAGLPSVA